MNAKQFICVVLCGALVMMTNVARAQSGGDFILNWSTADGGGGTTASGAWSISGTAGQPDAAKVSGGDFQVQGGFWNRVTANYAPVANSDTITRNGGSSSVKVAIATLLTNDTDSDKDALTFVSVTSSQGGVPVTVNGSYIFYVPTNSVNGDDIYTYTVRDAFGGRATGTVNVHVTSNVQSRRITLVPATNSFAGSFFGILNTPYTVQYATNLNSSWHTLTNVTTSSSTGFAEFNDPGPFAPERYYRIVYP